MERRGGGIGLTGHSGVRGRSGPSSGSRSVSSGVLVLERIEILERHIGVDGFKDNRLSGLKMESICLLKLSDYAIYKTIRIEQSPIARTWIKENRS